jgi:molecular chaperone DnaK (HSP70)
VQRFLTLDAFRKAGFNVLATLNEPSAAGFEYSHRHRNTLSSRREHVVVYDLGGGTFDASLVRMSGRLHDAVTTAGMQRLGGDDFDDVLLEMVLEAADCPRSKLNSRSLASLFDLCRDAKERLHPNSKRIVIDVDQAIGKQSAVAVVTIGVNEYYEKCTPLVEKTIEAMTPVMSRLERDAPISDPAVPEDVAGIYVVGGASSLPIVVRLLRERFGRRVHRSPYPSAATAVGLAIASDRDAGFELSDRFSRTFGVFREITAGHDVGFDTVFHRDTQLPSPGQPALCADRVYRPVHNLGHFRYVECSDLDYHGTPIGDISLFADVRFPYDPELQKTGVDIAKVNVQRLDRHGPTIRERYQLDAHGMVALTVTDLSTGYERVYKFGN